MADLYETLQRTINLLSKIVTTIENLPANQQIEHINAISRAVSTLSALDKSNSLKEILKVDSEEMQEVIIAKAREYLALKGETL
jgi:hypothetical protein